MEAKKCPSKSLRILKGKRPGDDLLSHRVVVSSALEGLTTVFGMGTGVTPPLKSPGRREHLNVISFRVKAKLDYE